MQTNTHHARPTEGSPWCLNLTRGMCSQGIFVTKVQPGGPAASVIQPGDKILQVHAMVIISCMCMCVCGVWVVCAHVCVGRGEVCVCCGFRVTLFCSTIFMKVLPMKPADSSMLLFWDSYSFCATGHVSCVYIQTVLVVGDVDTDSLCLAVLGTPFITCRAAADYLPSLIGIIDF